MLKIILIISDEQGIISNIEKSFDSSSVMHNFEEIETCCEDFAKPMLPQAEAKLVAYGQGWSLAATVCLSPSYFLSIRHY